MNHAAAILFALAVLVLAAAFALLWLLRRALRDALVLQGALAKTVERVIEAMKGRGL